MSAELEIPDHMHIEDSHEEPEGERQLSPREVMMNQIAEKAEARRQEEMALGRIYDDDARAAGLTFPEDEQGREPEAEAPREPEQHADAPREYVGPSQPAMRVVEVDGRRFEVTAQQYDELAQMGALANVALHQYANQTPQQQQQYQPQPQQAQPQQPLVDPEMVREAVRRIQYGGEEDGAQALSNLVYAVASRQPQQQHIDPNAIAQQAAAMAQQQARFAAETALIQQEYKDVFADPQRTQLAKLNVDALRQRNIATGKYQSDLEIYREAGDLVLNALKLPRSQATGQQPALQAASSRDSVIERKRTAPKSTTQVDRRAPSPSAPRPPSGSEIVEQMRQSRGQQSMR